MNTIGIEDNLNRARIKKLLTIGLCASIITGTGDFLLGYGVNIPGESFAANLMANAVNLSDAQLICGSLLGFVGIFLEGLSFFAVYRLMADKSPRYAHMYRTGIFGYIWLAPICHLSVGIFNYVYKYLLMSDPVLAEQVGNTLLYAFGMPVWWLLILFWLPMIIIQFRAISKGLTPYPKYARWFNLIVGAIPPLVAAIIIGSDTALGSAIGTMSLSFGNALTFGGLLAALPGETQFAEFKKEAGNM